MLEIEDPENEGTDDDEEEEDSDNPRDVLEAWVADQDDAVKAMFKEGTDGLLSALKKERDAAKEAAGLEKKLEEANKKLDAYKTDEEKDLEAGQIEIADLTGKLTIADDTVLVAVAELVKERTKFAVTVEALKMGFEDPADAQALLPEDSKVKYDKKTNKVEGVKEALKKLVEEKPYLLGVEPVGTPRSSGRRKLGADDKKAPVVVKI